MPIGLEVSQTKTNPATYNAKDANKRSTHRPDQLELKTIPATLIRNSGSETQVNINDSVYRLCSKEVANSCVIFTAQSYT